MAQHVLVVGGTRGIGAAITEALIAKGIRVTFTGRTAPYIPNEPDFSQQEDSAAAAATTAPTQPSNEKEEEQQVVTPQPQPLGLFHECDVSTLKGAWELGNRLQGRDFDTVVFCVGMANPPKLQRNSENVEISLAVSYLSRFILLQHFSNAEKFPKLKRVFVYGGYLGANNSMSNVADINFETEGNAYNPITANLNIAVLNECLVYETKRRFAHLDVYGMNPGLLATGIRDAYHGGNSNWISWALERAIKAFNPSPKEYVERTVLPLLLLQAPPPPSPITFSQSGTPLEPMGWASLQANRIKAWEASQEFVNKVL